MIRISIKEIAPAMGTWGGARMTRASSHGDEDDTYNASSITWPCKNCGYEPDEPDERAKPLPVETFCPKCADFNNLEHPTEDRPSAARGGGLGEFPASKSQ